MCADIQLSAKTLSAAVKSIEDHGYILDLGMPDVSGFLSFKDAIKGPFDHNSKLHVGRLVDVSVSKMSGNGRICTVTVDSPTFVSSSVCQFISLCALFNWCVVLQLSEITSVTSILPGALVQSLITAVVPSGLNLQILGYFEGTVDQVHLYPGKKYKIGQKVKARIVYDISGTSPPKFALALVDHIIALDIKRAIYAVGTMRPDKSVVNAVGGGGILDRVDGAAGRQRDRGVRAAEGDEGRVGRRLHGLAGPDRMPELCRMCDRMRDRCRVGHSGTGEHRAGYQRGEPQPDDASDL